MGEKGRAAVYHGLGKPMEIVEYPITDPEPGAILIKITRANICGSDLHMWRGDLDLAAIGMPMPIILGHEMTGVVSKLGKGITTDSTGDKLKEGDRVVYPYFYPCGRCPACLRGHEAACQKNGFFMMPSQVPPHFNGAYADYYYLRPGHVVFKVPDDLSDDVIAPINCALSEVIYGLDKVGLKLGETIVIQGAGGLGIYATAVAREMGANKIIIIDGIDERLDLARKFSVDHVIDMKEYKTPSERSKKVRELTGGAGADVVAELVGFPQVVSEGLTMLGVGGRMLEIGNISPGTTFELDPAILVMKSISIVSVIYYNRSALKKAIDFLSRSKDKYPFDKIISKAYPLEEIEKAFEEQDKGLVSRSTIVP